MQNIGDSFFEMKGANAFTLFLYYVKVVPESNRFFYFNLEPKSCAFLQDLDPVPGHLINIM